MELKTFTLSQGIGANNNVVVNIAHITHFQKSKDLGNDIFFIGGHYITVKEPLREIENALLSKVSSNPTNDHA